MMQAPVSKVEAFFERYQFMTRYLLCASDCETTDVRGVLQLAGVSVDDLLNVRLGYTRGNGSAELRELIAGLYRTGHPDHILSLAAPIEGIYLTVRALVDPGDHVVVQWPAFSPLLDLPHLVGAQVSLWRMRPRGGAWEADLDELATLVRGNTRLIITNFPHNPTGYVPSEAFLTRLANIADKCGAWLFGDEIFSGLESPSHPSRSIVDLYPRALALDGLSKVYGLPGLRVGWLAVSDLRLRENLFNWRAYTSQCSSAPSEFLAAAVLRSREVILKRNYAIVKSNLALTEDFFERWRHLFVYRPPQGGTSAFVELLSGNASELCERAVREADIMLLPSSCFEMPDRYLRFGFGRENFPEALQRFDEHLRQYQET